MMIYNDLVRYYEALHQELSPTAIQEKVNALSTYIHENAEDLSKDLLDNSAHAVFYRDMKAKIGGLSGNSGKDLIKEIERIQYNSELLTLQALSPDLDGLATWLNKHLKGSVISRGDFESSPSKVLDAFDEVKESLKPVGNILSKLVVSSFGLETKKMSEVGALFKSGKIDARAVAHFVDAKKRALKYLELSVEELSLLVPHLHYVDSRDIPFKDDDEAQKFIRVCSNAHNLVINSDKIKELNNLPAALEKLDCRECISLEKINCGGCTSLTELTLSSLLMLKELDCQRCVSLTTITHLNLTALEKIKCRECTSLTGLECSSLPSLREFDCSGCTSLKKLTLSNCPALTVLLSANLPCLTTLEVSNLSNLRMLTCSNCPSLTVLQLSNLERLTFLYCEKCTSLTALELSNFLSLKDFSCEECTSLQVLTLSDLPALKEIATRRCTSLKKMTLSNLLSLEIFNCSNGLKLLTELELSNLPSLTQLISSYCPSLTGLTLSNLPNLREFDYDHCPALKEITLSDLLRLNYLDFNNFSSLTTITLSNLPKLERLICFGCKSLAMLTLSDLVSLKRLDHSRCDSLTRLKFSNLAKLKNFECSYLTSLKALEFSSLDSLESLISASCQSLTEFKLLNLSALKKLNFSKCTSLRESIFSNLTALEEFNCKGCTALENIRALSFPRCRTVDHSGCLRLRQLPQLPNGCNVISYNSIGFTSFEVDPEDLEKQPLDVLCHLGEHLLTSKRMPNIVYLHSPGLDHGGLRRQLVTTLLKNLFEKGSLLSFAEEGVEGVLPRISDLKDERQIFAFRTLGALVALASFGSLPLGRYFRDNFYYALLNLDGEDQVEAYRLLYALPEGDQVAPEEIEEDIKLILPIVHASSVFKHFIEKNNLETFRKNDLNEFISLVAGEEVTYDNFQKSVIYKGDDNNVIEGYFRNLFNEFEKKEPQKLIDMIELFTSTRSFGREKIKIFIEKEKDTTSLFKIATCFQQVTIPKYETYEKFKEKLFKTAEHVLGRFDKA